MIRFIGKLLFLLLVICIIVWLVSVLNTNVSLKNEVIRLHIIANSNTEADQTEKTIVRDEILAYMEKALSEITTREDAENFLRAKLPDIEKIVNDILDKNGSEHIAKVKFGAEAFAKRIYETFTLPSGVYESLQIEIGEAEGENWWCVVFPNLCLSTNAGDFSQVAASAGFGDDVITAISGTNDYNIRFYVLDFIGKLENLFLNH